jgi:unsaturated pyranuronate lyase
MAPMFTHVRWNQVENQQLNPLLERRFISTDDMTLARFVLRKGCFVPTHHHPNEQVSFIIDGSLRFVIYDHELDDELGKELVVSSGEVVVIPPNVPHQAEALVDTLALDVFHPARADFAAGTDDYLRRKTA